MDLASSRIPFFLCSDPFDFLWKDIRGGICMGRSLYIVLLAKEIRERVACPGREREAFQECLQFCWRKGCWATKWQGYHGHWNPLSCCARVPPGSKLKQFWNSPLLHLLKQAPVGHLFRYAVFPLPMPLLSLVPRPLVWVRPNLLAQDLETHRREGSKESHLSSKKHR